jgi:hypothetical protein
MKNSDYNRSMIVPDDVHPAERAAAFLMEYVELDSGALVSIRAGYLEMGGADIDHAAVVIEMGDKVHGLTVTEARALCRLIEDTQTEFPAFARHSRLQGLVEPLRAACSAAEEIFRRARAQ